MLNMNSRQFIHEHLGQIASAAERCQSDMMPALTGLMSAHAVSEGLFSRDVQAALARLALKATIGHTPLAKLLLMQNHATFLRKDSHLRGEGLLRRGALFKRSTPLLFDSIQA
jgi:hypothetical protein